MAETDRKLFIMFNKRIVYFYVTFIVGLFCGVFITKYKTIETQNRFNAKIDSLNLTIKEQEEVIELLEDLCSDKESEISYWGQKYDDCNSLK